MMRSLFSGVSGLKNHQTKMDVIGNNISNVNTNGFKSSRIIFADTLSQTMTGAASPTETLGGINPKQVGLGSEVSSIDLIFTDGSVQSTGKNTDLCLSGNGLFVVSNGNQIYYTRNGAFEFDANGGYVMPGSGLLVQGWTAVNGSLNTADAIGNIVIPAGKSMAAQATSRAVYVNNLDAAAPTITSISGGVNKTSYVVTSASDEKPVDLTILTMTCKYTGNIFQFYSYLYYTVEIKDSDKSKIIITDSTGHSQTLDIDPPATEAVPAGTHVNYSGGEQEYYITASRDNPIELEVGGNTYTVTSGDLSVVMEYTVKEYSADRKSVTLLDKYGDEHVLVLEEAANYAVPAGTSVDSFKNVTRKAEASSDAPVTLTMSDGSVVIQNSGIYNVGHSLPVTTTLTIYDSLGNAHSLPIYFTKTNIDSTNGNTWTVSINTDGSGETAIDEADGTTTIVTMEDTELDFTTEGKYDTNRNTGGRTITLTLVNGSTGTQTITLDLSNLTQYAGNSTINGNTNGNAAGTLESVSIDASGAITGIYTNGVKQIEAQVAVAQFTNAAGLTKTGSSLYQNSNNSGSANIKTAVDLGVKITASALEMSNVDIANEFAEMIITQRGFQSNSKIITVGDEMLESIINMKR